MYDLVKQWWSDLADDPIAQLVVFVAMFLGRVLLDRYLANREKKKGQPRSGPSRA